MQNFEELYLQIQLEQEELDERKNVNSAAGYN